MPGFPRWIGSTCPKAVETLAKSWIRPFTLRIRRDSATYLTVRAWSCSRNQCTGLTERQSIWGIRVMAHANTDPLPREIPGALYRRHARPHQAVGRRLRDG